MVKGEYFRSINYLSQAKWTDIWQNCMKLDYKPMVNIQVVKPNEKDLTSGAIGLDMTDGTAKRKSHDRSHQRNIQISYETEFTKVVHVSRLRFK